MLYTKFQGHRFIASGEEDFLRFSPYIGIVAMLVMWPNSFVQIIRAATIYQYTGKLRFALNKHRTAVHFWLYRYINLPFVSSDVHFPLKFATKNPLFYVKLT